MYIWPGFWWGIWTYGEGARWRRWGQARWRRSPAVCSRHRCWPLLHQAAKADEETVADVGETVLWGDVVVPFEIFVFEEMSWYFFKDFWQEKEWTNILIVGGGPVQDPQDGSHYQHDQPNATPDCGGEHWGKRNVTFMAGQDISWPQNRWWDRLWPQNMSCTINDRSWDRHDRIWWVRRPAKNNPARDISAGRLWDTTHL